MKSSTLVMNKSCSFCLFPRLPIILGFKMSLFLLCVIINWIRFSKHTLFLLEIIWKRKMRRGGFSTYLFKYWQWMNDLFVIFFISTFVWWRHTGDGPVVIGPNRDTETLLPLPKWHMLLFRMAIGNAAAALCWWERLIRKYKMCICKIKQAADSYTNKVIMAQVLRPNNAEAPRGSNQKFILIIMWILH